MIVVEISHIMVLNKFKFTLLKNRGMSIYFAKLVQHQIDCNDLLQLINILVTSQSSTLESSLKCSIPKTNMAIKSPIYTSLPYSYNNVNKFNSHFDIFTTPLSQIKMVYINILNVSLILKMLFYKWFFFSTLLLNK